MIFMDGPIRGRNNGGSNDKNEKPSAGRQYTIGLSTCGMRERWFWECNRTSGYHADSYTYSYSNIIPGSD